MRRPLTPFPMFFSFYLLAIFNSMCHGYIDLGSGSYLIQVLLASFLGLSFTLKNFWKRIFGILFAFLPKKAPHDSSSGK